MSAQHKQIGKRLRAARRRRDITQRQLAEKLGRSTSYVTRYESGARALNVVDFLLITRALGMSPHAVLRRLEADLFVEPPQDNG